MSFRASGGPTPGAVAITETPGCRESGRFVRGGGYGATPPAAGLVSGPVVFGDILRSTGWEVSVQSIDGSRRASRHLATAARARRAAGFPPGIRSPSSSALLSEVAS